MLFSVGAPVNTSSTGALITKGVLIAKRDQAFWVLQEPREDFLIFLDFRGVKAMTLKLEGSILRVITFPLVLSMQNLMMTLYDMESIVLFCHLRRKGNSFSWR